ncbi:MAG: alpha/beta hydrolase [Rhodobacteraceae bacterium]|nr:alpha/beta hydrolase [Paracoccaceae bacterium]MAY46754.1 alpha/beta hydrolase [Paracoccaceae bacterium]
MNEVLRPAQVHVVDLGQGPRAMLALHCTMAYSGAWKGVARALEGQARITAFDLPGHGQSADWDGQGDLVDHVAGIGRGLLGAPMDVIGHSFGAVAALRIALTRPDRVRTLTLVEPVLMGLARDTPEFALHEADSAPMWPLLDAGDVEGAARHFNAMWATEKSPAWEDLPENTRRGMIRAFPLVGQSHPALYDDAADLYGPGRLESLTCPVLLIEGADTHPIIGRIIARLSARIPDCDTCTIPGAGHMVPITHPVRTAAAIRAFLDRHPV